MPRLGFTKYEDFEKWVDKHVDSSITPYECYFTGTEVILEPMRNKKERDYVLARLALDTQKALDFLEKKGVAIYHTSFYDWRIDGTKTVSTGE